MAPVFDRINENALQPYLNEEIGVQQALTAAEEPIRGFMLATNARVGFRAVYSAVKTYLILPLQNKRRWLF